MNYQCLECHKSHDYQCHGISPDGAEGGWFCSQSCKDIWKARHIPALKCPVCDKTLHRLLTVGGHRGCPATCPLGLS